MTCGCDAMTPKSMEGNGLESGEEKELGRRYFASIELDWFVPHVEQKFVFCKEGRQKERAYLWILHYKQDWEPQGSHGKVISGSCIGKLPRIYIDYIHLWQYLFFFNRHIFSFSLFLAPPPPPKLVFLQQTWPHGGRLRWLVILTHTLYPQA